MPGPTADDTPVAAPGETPVTAAITKPPPDQTVVTRGRSRRRGPLIAGAAVVAVAAVVVAVVVLSGGDSSHGGGGGAAEGPTTEAAAPFVFTGEGSPTTAAGVPGAAPRRSGAVVMDGLDDPLTIPDAGPQAQFGSAIASADFDSDGKADLAVGAAGAESVSVFAGSDDLAGSQPTTLPGGGRFGAALAAADFDGDGYPDLAVGAPDGDGTIRIFSGGANGLSGERDRTIEPSGGLAGGFGSVLAAGDVDDDGKADLVEAGNGHASVCLAAQDCTALGAGLEGDVTALAVGDITGDGTADIAQGVPEGGKPVPDEPDTGEVGPPGLIRIWPGGDSGPGGEPIVIDQDTRGVRGNDQAHDDFGAALAIADLDGDEFMDLVVGAPGEDGDFGRVTVVRGGAEGHAAEDGFGYGSKTPDLPVKIDSGSRLGTAIALRDVDGDGNVDLIAAAPGSHALVTLPGVGDGEFTGTGSTALDLPGGAAAVSLG